MATTAITESTTLSSLNSTSESGFETITFQDSEQKVQKVYYLIVSNEKNTCQFQVLKPFLWTSQLYSDTGSSTGTKKAHELCMNELITMLKGKVASNFFKTLSSSSNSSTSINTEIPNDSSTQSTFAVDDDITQHSSTDDASISVGSAIIDSTQSTFAVDDDVTQPSCTDNASISVGSAIIDSTQSTFAADDDITQSCSKDNTNSTNNPKEEDKKTSETAKGNHFQ